MEDCSGHKDGIILSLGKKNCEMIVRKSIRDALNIFSLSSNFALEGVYILHRVAFASTAPKYGAESANISVSYRNTRNDKGIDNPELARFKGMVIEYFYDHFTSNEANYFMYMESRLRLDYICIYSRFLDLIDIFFDVPDVKYLSIIDLVRGINYILYQGENRYFLHVHYANYFPLNVSKNFIKVYDFKEAKYLIDLADAKEEENMVVMNPVYPPTAANPNVTPPGQT